MCTNQPVRWLFPDQNTHFSLLWCPLFSLRCVLLCSMHYSVLRVIYFEQQMIFLRFLFSPVPLLLSAMKFAYNSKRRSLRVLLSSTSLSEYNKEEKARLLWIVALLYLTKSTVHNFQNQGQAFRKWDDTFAPCSWLGEFGLIVGDNMGSNIVTDGWSDFMGQNRLF